jgi:hypothetical protein
LRPLGHYGKLSSDLLDCFNIYDRCITNGTAPNKEAYRSEIEALGRKLAKGTEPPHPVKHYFSPGLYIREISIPAGSLVIGQIHRHEHPNIISKGRVTVMTEEDGVKEYSAPATFMSSAGIQKTLYVHEDCVWSTMWPTTDITKDTPEENIMKYFASPSYAAMEKV